MKALVLTDRLWDKNQTYIYGSSDPETAVKPPLKNRQNKYPNEKW